MTININRNTVLVAAVAVIVGFGAGYAVGNCDKADRYRFQKQFTGMHRMPDGAMMRDDGSMRGMMDDMSAALEGKTGDAFDQAFLEQMIVHHEGAVVMAKAAQERAGHQEVKDLGGAIVTAQEKEIADMKAWLKAWYGR